MERLPLTERRDHTDFRRDFRTANDRNKRAFRNPQRLFEKLELDLRFFERVQSELQTLVDENASGNRLLEKRAGVSRRDLQKILLTLKTLEMEADDARRRMMEANLRLVISVARKIAGNGPHLMDLIQEGNIGSPKPQNPISRNNLFKI